MEFLSDVTVLELSENISASASTKLMAALGARVIKIERPDGGDPTRRMGPFPDDDPHPEKSGLFLYLNMGKKDITLNIHTKEGQNVFRKLVAKADILVEDLGPGQGGLEAEDGGKRDPDGRRACFATVRVPQQEHKDRPSRVRLPRSQFGSVSQLAAN
jgi:hypothetical protein